jgi:hypothetical protein
MGSSHSLRAAKQRTIHGINNRLRANLPTAKETAIEPLDCVLASLDAVELEVDVPLGVGVKGDVDDVAVFFFAFGADVGFELVDPAVAFFSVGSLASASNFGDAEREGLEWKAYSAGLNIFLSKTHRLAWLTATGSGLVSVFGLAILALSLAAGSVAGSSVLASFLINASRL